jgi:23S rRNA (guanosine2251-2'-O)-methyltransferase
MTSSDARFGKTYRSGKTGKDFDRKPLGGKKPPAATLAAPRPRETTRLPDSNNDLIFGVHSVAAALANGKRKLVHLWATENGLLRLDDAARARLPTTDTVHPRVLDHLLTGQDAVHQGLVLEAKPLTQPRLDQVERKGLVLMLDQVTDPHNVGAILRSCAAFGVGAVVTTHRNAPHETGVFFKAASGATEHVPLVRVTNLAAAMEELQGYGFHLIGLDSESDTPLEQAVKPGPMALVLGAEGKGLREKTRATCNVMARLDMPGAIKSLNVSIAAAISLYVLGRPFA